MGTRVVKIIGGGPAGAAAALAVSAGDAIALLFEKSPGPRHKVCGEFLSPGVAEVLDLLGVGSGFAALRPEPIRFLRLLVGRREKRCRLPETACGLSRYALDHFLRQEAIRRGASIRTCSSSGTGGPTVVATGRTRLAPTRQTASQRLFGFKAHFAGPVNDAVELFFFGGCYAGVSPVENGTTNVCGLAPAGVLRRHRFRFDELLAGVPALRERLSDLRRVTPWMTTGPLVFGRRFQKPPGEAVYPAGDAFGFVDPFTGSGILNALWTGRLAGLAALQGMPARDYYEQCEKGVGGLFFTAWLFRQALAAGLAEALLPVLPGQWLFRATRPAAPAPWQFEGM